LLSVNYIQRGRARFENPMLSSLDHIAVQLQERWVPKWYEAFLDTKNGGFHERLTYQFVPMNTGYKRLVTQCRQLAIYAHAQTISGGSAAIETGGEGLISHFHFLRDHYYRSDHGGWIFSCTDSGEAKDSHYDLYAHGFVLFALSHYFRATQDEEGRSLAIKTADFIKGHFKMPDGLPGFAEALDVDLNIIPRIRRQNPHMHLFEGVLFAWKTYKEPVFKELSENIYQLFSDFFFDKRTGTLGEFYDDFLKPHATDGQICEPGHHYEWVWLLHLYAQLFGDTSNIYNQKRCLFEWAEGKGHDREYGGIYNSLNRQGYVIDDHKRIWPLTEALKAHLCMLDDAPSAIDRGNYKHVLTEVLSVLSGGYLQKRGFWTEIMDRHLLPETDYMPGTTPYHLYFGIMESVRLSHERGQSPSWAVLPYRLQFKMRRRLSRLARRIIKTKAV